MAMTRPAARVYHLLQARWPQDHYVVFRCERNVAGEWQQHAWGNAVDHYAAGWWGRRRMAKGIEYARALGRELDLELALYDGKMYRLETGFLPEPIPPEVNQHTDHAHYSFLPRQVGQPPECP